LRFVVHYQACTPRRLTDGQRSRAVVNLFIIDAHLASLFHRKPLLSPAATGLYRVANDTAFNASSAQEWKDHMTEKSASRDSVKVPPPENSSLSFSTLSSSEGSSCKSRWLISYFILQNISAKVAKQQMSGQLDEGTASFRETCDELIAGDAYLRLMKCAKMFPDCYITSA
jgi:hypothetical protein